MEEFTIKVEGNGLILSFKKGMVRVIVDDDSLGVVIENPITGQPITQTWATSSEILRGKIEE